MLKEKLAKLLSYPLSKMVLKAESELIDFIHFFEALVHFLSMASLSALVYEKDSDGEKLSPSDETLKQLSNFEGRQQ